MNCSYGNSCYDRNNRCCENTGRRLEYVKEECCMPCCPKVEPRRECECKKPVCCDRSKQDCCCETKKPVCCDRPKQDCCCEVKKPVCGCKQNEQVSNIVIVNDCSCQEFMRIYDWYNCTADKAHREFLEAEKELKDAIDCIIMGLGYNAKAKEFSQFMDEYLDSMKEDHDKDMNCGCNTTCGCRNTCERSNTCGCNSKRMNPCTEMREQLHEMMEVLNCLEGESLKHAQQSMDKLMEAKQMHKCLCELKEKIAKNCYLKC